MTGSSSQSSFTLPVTQIALPIIEQQFTDIDIDTDMPQLSAQWSPTIGKGWTDGFYNVDKRKNFLPSDAPGLLHYWGDTAACRGQ